jgi:hypothetical protein
MNFVPSKYLNNRTFNSQATLYPSTSSGGLADVGTLIFTKGGMRTPLGYDIRTQFEEAPQGDGSLLTDGQIFKLFSSCFSKFSDGAGRIQVQPSNMNKDTTMDASSVNVVRDGGYCYGIGIVYDNYDNGVDFSNMTMGTNLTLSLNDINSPNSVFMFVHAKNTMVFNQSGLEIIN